MNEVRGLNSEMYFINNPIFVEVETDEKRLLIEVIHNNITRELVFDVYNDLVVFDLAILAKTLMPLPHYDSIFEQQQSTNILRNVRLKFYKIDEDDNQTLFYQTNHTFIRGGFIVGNNISVQDGAELIESDSVPVWVGYPSYYAEIEGTEIIWQSLPPQEKMDIIKERNCNGVYLCWLNSKGGYSFWLFEAWEMRIKADETEIINRYRPSYNYQGFQTTGNDSQYSLNVKSIIPKKYFNHIKSLVNSPDVWLYNLEDIADYYGNINPFIPPINNAIWKRIANNGNSFSWSNSEKTKEISFDFDIVNTENRRLLW